VRTNTAFSAVMIDLLTIPSFLSSWAYQTSAPIKDYAYAVYATGKSGGSRKYPYSTSK